MFGESNKLSKAIVRNIYSTYDTAEIPYQYIYHPHLPTTSMQDALEQLRDLY